MWRCKLFNWTQHPTFLIQYWFDPLARRARARGIEFAYGITRVRCDGATTYNEPVFGVWLYGNCIERRRSSWLTSMISWTSIPRLVLREAWFCPILRAAEGKRFRPLNVYQNYLETCYYVFLFQCDSVYEDRIPLSSSFFIWIEINNFAKAIFIAKSISFEFTPAVLYPCIWEI